MVRIPRWARTPPVTRRSVLRRDGGLCVVLLATGRHHRPRHPAQQGRHPRLVQRRRRLQARQPRQGRSAPLRAGLDDAREAGPAGRAPLAVAAPVGRGPVVGAVSRRGLLRLAPLRRPSSTSSSSAPRPQRVAVAREVTGPTLVLGSTQPTELVDPAPPCRARVELARRRGGGGAVVPRAGRPAVARRLDPAGRPALGRRRVGRGRVGRGVVDGRLWPASGSVRLRGAPRAVGARGLRRPGLLRRPRTGRGVPRRAARWSGSRSGGRGRGPVLVVRLPALGSRRRCWRSCTWTQDARIELARRLAPLAAGLAELEPPVADLVSVRDRAAGLVPDFRTP